MRRGTTPKNTFLTSIDLTSAEVMYITYSQKGVTVIEKSLPDITVTADKLEVTLTQEDTLKFDAQQKLEIQIRAKLDGEAIASDIIETTVGKILKEGAI